MLGATVVPVTTGSRTLKDAHQRGAARLGGQRRRHPLPARHGRRPAPVPGDGARLRPAASASRRARSASTLTGALPDAVAACVGGGSNAIGIFHAFVPRRGRAAVRLRGRRRRRRHRPARGAASPAASTGVLHGARTYVLQDDDGQTIESHSISAGLDYPGVGPGARLAARHRPGPLRAGRPTPRRWPRSQLLCRTEGIIPAIESAHALAGALRVVPALTAELGREPRIVVNLSGRGDKDVHTAGAYFGILDEERR